MANEGRLDELRRRMSRLIGESKADPASRPLGLPSLTGEGAVIEDRGENDL